MNHRYRARYNIQGEVHELWGWYANEVIAGQKLHKKLNKKMGRVVFLDGINYEVARVDPISNRATK